MSIRARHGVAESPTSSVTATFWPQPSGACGGQRKDGKGEVGRVMGFSKQHIVHHPKRKGFKARSSVMGVCSACWGFSGGAALSRVQVTPSQYHADILGM